MGPMLRLTRRAKSFVGPVYERIVREYGGFLDVLQEAGKGVDIVWFRV